jgi:hypothetical protein
VDEIKIMKWQKWKKRTKRETNTWEEAEDEQNAEKVGEPRLTRCRTSIFGIWVDHQGMSGWELS